VNVVRDPYEVLGVPRTASTPQIRAAYVRHARLAHPDLNGDQGIDVMRALNDAWEILKDAARRQAWDAAHHAGSAGHQRNGAVHGEEIDGRPFWTGAMGPPPGRPSGSVLQFGIYDGWSLGEIARRDRGYLIWLRDRPEGQPLSGEIERLLSQSGEEPEPRLERRRWFGGR
jgi:curved DNA-binding protein CbpA